MGGSAPAATQSMTMGGGAAPAAGAGKPAMSSMSMPSMPTGLGGASHAAATPTPPVAPIASNVAPAPSVMNSGAVGRNRVGVGAGNVTNTGLDALRTVTGNAVGTGRGQKGPFDMLTRGLGAGLLGPAAPLVGSPSGTISGGLKPPGK